MTRNMHRKMLQRDMLRKLQRKRKRIAFQKEVLIILALGLLSYFGMVLIAL